MADFEYNQIISAVDLNNIAIDLGAGTFSEFSDSTPYAVDQLNDITAALVGSGILDTANNCSVSVSGDNLVIATGVAVFESGKKIKVDTPITIGKQTGDVFFYENPVSGAVTAEVGTLPADGYVLLANVSAGGTLTDRRAIAKAKVTLPTEADSYSYTLEVTSDNYFTLSNNPLILSIAGAKMIFIECSYAPSGVYTQLSKYFYNPANGYIDGFYKYYDAQMINRTAGTEVLRKDTYSSHYDIDFTPTVSGDNLTLTFTINHSGLNFVYPTTIKIYIFGGV